MDVLARAHALEAAGRRVIHMEIGEPDFTAAPQVVEAAVKALRDGRTAYTATLGLPALREAIAAHYRSRFGREVSASRIAITSGASGGLLLTLALYVNPGDEILVPDPGYPGYRHMVRAFEGVARPLKVSPATNFQPTLEMVRAAWGRRTRGLLLGSPANPTGTSIATEELAKIARFVASRAGVLIVDEIYQGLSYGGAPTTALGLPGEVVVVNSFSKYFCMTGWRLGWVVAAAEDACANSRKWRSTCPSARPRSRSTRRWPAFARDSLQIFEKRRLEFQRRRDFLVPALERAGLDGPGAPDRARSTSTRAAPQDGTGAWTASASRWSCWRREGVAATPGIDFGVARNEALRALRLHPRHGGSRGGRRPPEAVLRRKTQAEVRRVRPTQSVGAASASAPGARARRAP